MSKKDQKWKKADTGNIKKMTDGKPDDVIISIMGATGAGKSTLINEYLGIQSAKVGHGINSCTADVFHYFATIPGSKRRLVLVDTPGFNDTTTGESEILRRISVWLATAYSDNMKIAGVIYLSDISLKRMYGTIRTNLVMFQQLCGPDFFKKVVLATSHWDEVTPAIGEQRQNELKQSFWKDMLDGGSVMVAKKSAQDVHGIINRIVEQHLAATPTGKEAVTPLMLQKELVELDKLIPATKAGRELKSDLAQFLKEMKEAEKEEDDPKRKEEMTKKRMALQRQIKELNLPFSVRFLGFFGLG